MAVQGPFKVAFGELFPHGLGVVGAVGPVVDFDASTKERKVQARDKDTGLPVWSVDVMDFDPDARERTFKVKIAAPVQPVPPEAMDGLPGAAGGAGRGDGDAVPEGGRQRPVPDRVLAAGGGDARAR